MLSVRICRKGTAAFGLSVLLGLAAPAAAQRPDTREMTCSQARALVMQSGAAVLTTGRHTYDRFVSNRRQCTFGYDIERAWVPTRDRQSCNIGYRCVIDDREDFSWWWRFRR